MITEDYVSFELAKLLKEKGFRCDTLHYYYDKDGDLLFSACRVDAGKNEFDAPTLQMTMKWLREKYDLHIEITSIKPYGSDGNGHDIPLDGVKYHSNIVQNNKWIDLIKKFKSYNIACYSSYEEACEAGIKYCLENLI